MNKDSMHNISTSEGRLKSYLKRKYYLFKSLIISIIGKLKVLQKGLNIYLRKVKKGTYKNKFFLTKILLCISLWQYMINFKFPQDNIVIIGGISPYILILIAIIVDILVEPLKRLKFLIKSLIIVFITWNAITLTIIQARKLTKSLQNTHKENIAKQRGNKL